MKVRKLKHVAEARQATAEDVDDVRIWCGGEHLISAIGTDLEAAIDGLKAGFKLCDKDEAWRVVYIGDWVIYDNDDFTVCREGDYGKVWEKDE